METTSSSFNDLPSEIISKIIELAFDGDPSKRVLEYLLVCKAWSNPAQWVMFKDVYISAPSRLKKFYNAVEKQPQLGRRVEKLSCNFPVSDKTEIDNVRQMLVKLIIVGLPNLMIFRDVIEHVQREEYLNVMEGFYMEEFYCMREELFSLNSPALYVIDALFSEGKVKEFRILESGKKAAASEEYEPIQINYFHNDLPKIAEWNFLHVVPKTSDDIQVLEYITANCKSLNSLSYEFDPPRGSHSDLSRLILSIDDLSNIECSDIPKLICTAAIPGTDYSILLYIMHKFPKLKTFCLGIKLDNLQLIEEQMLTKILQFSGEIEYFELSISSVELKTLLMPFHDYWASHEMYELGELVVNIRRPKEKETTSTLDMIHGPDYPHIALTISPEEMECELIDFWKMNRSHVQFLMIAFEREDKQPLPKELMQQIFTMCPEFWSLYFSSCILKLLELKLDKEIQISGFYLRDCVFEQGALESLSRTISSIHNLRLYGYWIKNKREQRHLNMPFTLLEYIEFEGEHFEHGERIYVQIITEDQTHYFRYEKYREDEECLPIEFFNEDDEAPRITISCIALPESILF